MKINQLVLFIICISIFSCSQTKSHNDYVLRIKGSESMHEAFEMLKVEFERTQDSVTIIIEGGGSFTGLSAIDDNSADIGLSSYNFNLDSVLGAGHDVISQVVAFDGIVIISNTKNPITKMTDEQISGIYEGEITDWSQLGGEPGRIVPVMRDENSGTQKFFIEHFQVNKFNPMALVEKENKAIVSRVQENENGIGFIGFGYFTMGTNSIELANISGVEGEFISPTFENLDAGTYPLKRALYMYFRKDENPATKAFLKYLGSIEAHLVIKEHGLIPKMSKSSMAMR
jgi:phosphate transport system substrate-binding protein